MDFKNLEAYELVQEKQLTDLDSMGYLLRHKKSGARLFLVSNEDDNKVFSIGFRTPPVDSTGLTHILEHSVLCGSKHFPVKDPFVELVKGSLNTFLNAMTYPDKTVYPVASCNDKDFQNLMHVYLDAVFYPNIYEKEEIFKQEGWHYELEDADGDITINGVVYNEMKGAFSSPEGVLDREILNSLFPDTPYRYESGGDPEVIPSLTYEKFLDFHSTYYHPSNSYIYLYGDMDMEEKLRWLDSKYLSKFDAIEIDTKLPMQKPFAQMAEIHKQFSVTDEEGEKDNTYLSYNVAVATCLDRTLYIALEVLEYALLSAPGAPLKQALLDAGIGKDIMSSVDNGILQPIFSVIAKNANAEDKERFLQVISDTLEKIASEGFDKKSLLAGINAFEFKYREADFGRFPIGLSYGLQSMDSWLYDDSDPFMHLQENEIFAFLKEQVECGYFENLVKTYLIGNTHATLVMVEPKQGLNAAGEQKLKEKLAQMKASLSQEQIQALIDDTKHLKAYQDEPSAKEDLETIPMLEIADIKKEVQPFKNRFLDADNTTVIVHDYESKGIGYVNLLFDADGISAEDLPYVGILIAILGYVDTASYKFNELANEIHIHTGGMGGSILVYTDGAHQDAAHMKFSFKTKALFEELPYAFGLIKEILTTSSLKDEKRLLEILAQLKSRLQMDINTSGHSLSSMRAMSYFSESAKKIDATGGIDLYRLVEKLTDNFEDCKEAFVDKMQRLIHEIFKPENLLVGFTAKGYGDEAITGLVADLKAQLFTDLQPNEVESVVCEKKNEGFKTASKVNYVARCGNFKDAGLPYTGALKILKVILSYDYMWLNIRVKGGAYGCMSGFDRNGDSYFVSYRDPNLSKTQQVYEGILDYVKQFDVDERDMRKFIIGTISNMDTPLNASAKGSRSMMAYLTGISKETLQKERNQVLGASVEDIRALAPYMEAILNGHYICVIGDENKLNEESEQFETLEMLQ